MALAAAAQEFMKGCVKREHIQKTMTFSYPKICVKLEQGTLDMVNAYLQKICDFEPSYIIQEEEPSRSGHKESSPEFQ